MLLTILVVGAVLFAFQAIRVKQLIISALWLAGTSAILSVLFYMLGAYQVAVIELSVGAGLVTVLFVFAINVAGEETIPLQPIVPKALAIGLVILIVVLLGLFILPIPPIRPIVIEPSLTLVLWQQRSLDVFVQIVLIFAGVLGLLGLLAEAKAPLKYPVAEEVAARRERELRAMEPGSLRNDTI